MRVLVARGVVGQLGAVVYEHIAQPEAELQLGDEFEIGQIEVAAEAYGDKHVG